MKYLIHLIFLISVSTSTYAYEILALGTSNTNCKNANAAFTNTLNELLTKAGINAQAINAGVDGDVPSFMLQRMNGLINPNTKMVLFEPGPNERNKKWNLEAADKVLEELQKRKIVTIYISHQLIETNEEAAERSKKYGAYYYGRWTKGVPVDTEHRQYDYPPGSPGHMTAKGCALWANNIFPLIQQVIKEKDLR
jgi:hypothetical protein